MHNGVVLVPSWKVTDCKEITFTPPITRNVLFGTKNMSPVNA